MRVVGEANAYVSRPSRSSSRATTSASGSARCCTCWRRPSSDLNTLLAPFLPHAANAVARGPRRRAASSCRCRASRRSTDLDDGDAGALPGHHRRLLRDPALGVAPGRGRDADRQAGAGLHQARRVGRRRGAARLRATPRTRPMTPADVAARQAGRRVPPSRPTRCRSRSSTTTPTSTSARDGDEARSTSRPAIAAARRGRGRPDGPGRLRPARRPLHRRGRRPARRACSAASRCTPTRCRGWRPSGGLDAAYAEIERLAAPPADPGRRRDRARLLPHRARRRCRRSRTRSAGTSTSPSGSARPCRSTTATPTTTCCASSTRRARPSARCCTASPATRRWRASASSAATTSRSPAR